MENFGPIGDYLPIFILLVVAIGLGGLLTHASRLLGPFRPNRKKASVYESGMDPVGNAHERFSVKFYMVAMLFILFDIEIVFMYPWAVSFMQLGDKVSLWFPLIEMMIFVVILFVGYIYVWKKDALDWD